MPDSVSNRSHYALLRRSSSTLKFADNWPVLLYAAVVLAALPLTPLWLDEIQQLGNTRHGSLGELLQWAQLNKGASPLPYLIQRAVVNLLGYSTFAIRLPAALCSVAAGVVFAMLCRRFLKAGRALALGMLLWLPLQFRYGLEARAYSQGLLFTVLSIWLFLRLLERPSAERAVLYGLAVTLGLYSQPLTVFPALAEAACALRYAAVRRYALQAVAGAGFLYLPWYLAQMSAQARYAASTAVPQVFFSLHQIAPTVLLHDLSGGGYICTIALVALAALGWWKIPKEAALLPVLLTVSLAGPILMDAAFHYFFAERQLLFAMPALVLLAARALERRSMLVWALLAAFAASALWKDFRQATVPKDDLAATADWIAAHLDSEACFAAAPPEQADFYTFLHPKLEGRKCAAQPTQARVLAISSVYTSAPQRDAVLASLALPYRRASIQKIGKSEAIIFEKR